MGKTWRKERVIRDEDVHIRDDLNELRRGGVHTDKTKYTRKKKHSGKICQINVQRIEERSIEWA